MNLNSSLALFQKSLHLGICLSHPIQYKTPVLRKLASQPGIKLTVYYYSNRGLISQKNESRLVVPAWDIPLLDGYSCKFLPNLVNEEKWKLNSIQPFINPGIVKRIATDQIDALIIHSYQYPSDWLAFFTCKRKRIPVLFYGDMYPVNHRSLFRRIAFALINRPMVRGADACLAIGTVAQEVFRTEYQIPEERIFLAPYVVDNDYFFYSIARLKENKAQLKAELGIPDDLPVVLCVAAMLPVKRQQDVVLAMSNLRQPARLILVGHGPTLNEISSLCRDRLPETILTGFINQSELPRYYALADIFVLPSASERFGLVVNEAMCAGLPILVSNAVAASRDLVIDGENGFTFHTGDIEQLSQKIKMLVENPELRQNFGRRSLEIISDWNPGRTNTGILQALNYVISKKRGNQRSP